MTRHLGIFERRIDGSDQGAYMTSLAERRASAERASMHFWVFAHATDPYRYVEFVEGTDATEVAMLAGVDQDSLWRSVEVK